MSRTTYVATGRFQRPRERPKGAACVGGSICISDSGSGASACSCAQRCGHSRDRGALPGLHEARPGRGSRSQPRCSTRLGCGPSGGSQKRPSLCARSGRPDALGKAQRAGFGDADAGVPRVPCAASVSLVQVISSSRFAGPLHILVALTPSAALWEALRAPDRPGLA